MESNTKQIDWSKWDSKEDCFAKYSHVPSKLVYGQLPEKKPDVSIMIPTYQRANLLEEAIQSALHQKTRFSLLISVVDNDSNIDLDTDKLMKRYCAEYPNILYYRNKQNIGMFGNWNRCIELSQTEWLCMLHDDDMLMENYIESLFPITKRRKCGAICGFRSILDQRTNCKKHLNKTGKSLTTSLLMSLFILIRKGIPIPLTVQDAAQGLFMPSMANLLNKEALLKIGGFDEQFFPCSDVACYTKLEKDYEVLFVPKPIYWYRIAENESLKEVTCWKMMNASASLVKAISNTIDLSEDKCNNRFYNEIIKIFYTFMNAKEIINIKTVIEKFALPNKYSYYFWRQLILIKYNLNWGIKIIRKN